MSLELERRPPAGWRVGRREAAAMLAGVVLYAGMSWVTGFAAIGSPGAGATIRLGVAVPIFFGFVFGPLVGFAVGFGGNLLHDLLTGFAARPADASLRGVAAGLLLHWQVGNGLMGMIPGLAALRRRRYVTVAEQLRALTYLAVGVVAGIGLAVVLDPAVRAPPYNAVSGYVGAREDWVAALGTFFVPIVLTNLLNAAVIVPILLFNYERLDLRSRDLFRTRLTRRILLVMLVSAAAPIVLLSAFLVQAQGVISAPTAAPAVERGGALAAQLALTIGATTLLIVTSAALMAQSLMRPLLQVTRAAEAMRRGELSLDEAAALGATPGEDEVAGLSRVFGGMARQVIERETELRRQVQELQIVIDEKKKREQVREIVESDFFRDLQQKARTMRSPRRTPAPSDAPPDAASVSEGDP